MPTVPSLARFEFLARQLLNQPSDLPSNVAQFEQLMYISLAIGVIWSAFNWTAMVAKAQPVGGSSFVILVVGFTLAFFALFIWLIARRRKNWARWLLLVIGILGLPSYLSELPNASLAGGAVSLSQVSVEVVAFVLIFTGNANNWFRQS